MKEWKENDDDENNRGTQLRQTENSSAHYAKVNVFSCIVFVKWLRARVVVLFLCALSANILLTLVILRWSSDMVQLAYTEFSMAIWTSSALVVHSHMSTHTHTRTRRFCIINSICCCRYKVYLSNSLVLTHLFAPKKFTLTQRSETRSSIFHFDIENQQPWNRYLM